MKRILHINVSRIGDTLLATPVLQALAAAYPSAQIVALGHPKRAEVLEHLPCVTRVGRITKGRAPFLGWMQTARLARRYDLAVVHGFDAPLVRYALRTAERVVAFRQPDPALNRRLYRVADLPAARSVHAVHWQLRLTDALGIAPANLRLAYALTPAERAWARTELRSVMPASSSPLIGLQVASFPTKAYRDWPIGHFVALGRAILARWPNAYFLLFGGKLERARIETFHAAFPGHSRVFAGHLTLRQTAALMAEIDLYVGVDTGPTHIVGALGRPMVALYHGFSPSALLKPLDHPACYAIDHPRAGPECTPEVPMSEITVDDVSAAVVRALMEHPPSLSLEKA